MPSIDNTEVVSPTIACARVSLWTCVMIMIYVKYSSNVIYVLIVAEAGGSHPLPCPVVLEYSTVFF